MQCEPVRQCRQEKERIIHRSEQLDEREEAIGTKRQKLDEELQDSAMT